MKFLLAATPARCSALALAAAALTAGCSSVDNFLSGDKVDYRNGASRTRPLEVPPDLTQLARDPRYAPQGGVISAAATPQTPVLQQGSAAMAGVVPSVVGKVRVERAGQQRWLVAEAAPETVYPEVKAFWEERGFKLLTDNPQAGVMETDWVENRAKLPSDVIRSALGRFVSGLYDTGERDRYRTRVERSGSGTEVFITHKGLEEVYSNERKDSTVWKARDNDPALEAELLTRLMVRLGSKEEVAKTAVAQAPEQPARARALAEAGTLELDEPFDRAWRRVGLALDRGGFSVEDRDRSAGVYFVRYVDPKNAGKEEPNFFARLFGAKGPDLNPVRYRIVLKGSDAKTAVAVQTSAGAAERGDAGKAIVAQLVRDLR